MAEMRLVGRKPAFATNCLATGRKPMLVAHPIEVGCHPFSKPNMAITKMLSASNRPSPHVQFGGARSEAAASGRRVQVGIEFIHNRHDFMGGGTRLRYPAAVSCVRGRQGGWEPVQVV